VLFELASFALVAQAAGTGRPPTVPLTEGPFYKPGSPERTDLTDDAAGRRITITGTVYDVKGAPIPGAWLDFWQADGAGRYDNRGFRFRGHQLTDASGRYILQTVVPGEYPGRTPHIHVKLRAPAGPTVTTQIFFPGKTRNETDPIFDRSLVISGGRIDFVIPSGS
jgi:protocatechuate 3,4-dioxygenase beta subunit